MESAVVRSPWNDFPDVVVHSSVCKLKDSPCYRAAKQGNAKAACSIAGQLFKPGKILGKIDYVVPVIQVDQGHYNALPVAFASLLAKAVGAKLWLETYQANKVNHTQASAEQRFLRQPVFAGEVPKGNCLICDDVVTLGSSLVNLRGYLESRGCHVICATAIAAGYGSTRFQPEPKLLKSIQARYAKELEQLTERLGFGSECLTARESYFLAQIRTIDCLRNRCVEGESQRNSSRGVSV